MNVYEIALGGLLHDIGKFLQRANAPGAGLGTQSQGLTESICPTHDGRPTHQHVLYTNEFVESLSFLPAGMKMSEAANLASHHHLPASEAQQIIAEADQISSGRQREDVQEDDTTPGVRFRRTRLLSVAAVTGLGDVDAAKAGSFPLKPLSPEDAFPRTFPGEMDLTGEYAQLWAAFKREWAENACPDRFGFVARAMSVLERHTWCIPSVADAVPDISLYDHLKTTAAIAVCMAAHNAAADKPFLLVAGDLTGIQGYLYDIKMGSGSPAKRLRARSFHVGAYGQSIWLGILKRLDLPPTQVILSAGGKFHLLLPNTVEARKALEWAEKVASEWLMNETSGDMALALASVPCSRDELGDFSAALARLHRALRAERDRAGHGCLLQSGQWRENAFVLPVLNLNEMDGLCKCCGRRGAKNSTDSDGNEELKCVVCHDEEETGRRLPKARYAAFYADSAGKFAAPLGSYSVVAEDRMVYGTPVLVVDMNGLPDRSAPREWPLLSQAWARHAPRKTDGDLLMFEEIVQRSTGRPALAYLKMDVDDLGWMFAHGMNAGGRDRASMSRVATLSRTLEVFFRDHLQHLLRTKFPDVYLVYAGGDDLLALGPWDKILALACQIREDFRRFTGNNPKWSLSAGVALIGHHTPVLNATEEADKRLEGSKTLPGDACIPWPPQTSEHTAEPKKDRITAFETSIPWAEYGEVLNRANTLREWLGEGTINTGKVWRLLQCANLHRDFQRTRDTQYLSHVPMLIYDLKRNWKERSPQEQAAKEWANSLVTPDSAGMSVLRFVCEYALYGVRGRAKEQ